MHDFLKGCVIGGLISMLIIGLAQSIDAPDDLQQQQDLYCEMVAIHQDTGGRHGWPDYKHIAKEACQ